MTTNELIERLEDLDWKGDTEVRVTVEGQWAKVLEVERVMEVETEGDVPVIYLRTD